ncbi:MAG: hypothetical protein APR62_10645 [Smithella sp. SDB]|nr:MAG: hypothetical protein APR62_10645 [Smithella sp. SDB]
MKTQKFLYVAIVCAIVVIVLNLTEEKINSMDTIGIILSIMVIIISSIMLIKIRRKQKHGNEGQRPIK